LNSYRTSTKAAASTRQGIVSHAKTSGSALAITANRFLCQTLSCSLVSL
jgi:hypothetical protein